MKLLLVYLLKLLAIVPAMYFLVVMVSRDNWDGALGVLVLGVFGYLILEYYAARLYKWYLGDAIMRLDGVERWSRKPAEFAKFLTDKFSTYRHLLAVCAKHKLQYSNSFVYKSGINDVEITDISIQLMQNVGDFQYYTDCVGVHLNPFNLHRHEIIIQYGNYTMPCGRLSSAADSELAKSLGDKYKVFADGADAFQDWKLGNLADVVKRFQSAIGARAFALSISKNGFVAAIPMVEPRFSLGKLDWNVNAKLVEHVRECAGFLGALDILMECDLSEAASAPKVEADEPRIAKAAEIYDQDEDEADDASVFQLTEEERSIKDRMKRILSDRLDTVKSALIAIVVLVLIFSVLFSIIIGEGFFPPFITMVILGGFFWGVMWLVFRQVYLHKGLRESLLKVPGISGVKGVTSPSNFLPEEILTGKSVDVQYGFNGTFNGVTIEISYFSASYHHHRRSSTPVMAGFNIKFPVRDCKLDNVVYVFDPYFERMNSRLLQMGDAYDYKPLVNENLKIRVSGPAPQSWDIDPLLLAISKISTVLGVRRPLLVKADKDSISVMVRFSGESLVSMQVNYSDNGNEIFDNVLEISRLANYITQFTISERQ